MPIVEADDPRVNATPGVLCTMCETPIKRVCVREVRVELTISEEAGGGTAPDVLMSSEDGKSMLFCSVACARAAAKVVASEIQNPKVDEDGRYTFPAHFMWRGKIEKWDIHFTRVGPASYDKAESSDGGL